MYPRRAAHPHVCGEHQTVVNDGFIRHGSSPRVWGALHTRQPTLASARLIPTCVGSTTAWGALMPWNSAHPHVCGEHVPERLERLRGIGSSPRVWGARWRRRVVVAVRGLIPTCVGSTMLLSSMRTGMPAHPHVCGEHSTRPVKTLTHLGSSPRVWGARSACASYSARSRLIPTCVGSTSRIPWTVASAPAHPHVCGEHCYLRR